MHYLFTPMARSHFWSMLCSIMNVCTLHSSTPTPTPNLSPTQKHNIYQNSEEKINKSGVISFSFKIPRKDYCEKRLSGPVPSFKIAQTLHKLTHILTNIIAKLFSPLVLLLLDMGTWGSVKFSCIAL